MASIIAVDNLRVGMFVHLDGGWLSHPFPLSSFRIAGGDQLATLRGLGIKQVRWSPEKSELQDDAADTAHIVNAANAPDTAVPVDIANTADMSDTDDGAFADAVERPAPVLPTPTQAAKNALRAASMSAASDPAARAAAESRHVALLDQREAVQRCERQYGEAALAWRAANDAVGGRPEEARRTSEALAQAMLDKMLSDQDVAIRLISGNGGDRAAAHALNVTVIALLIGRMLGLPAEDMLDLGVGSLLHDVGKLELADRLRHLDDSFSSAEVAGYRDHVVRGVIQGRRMGLSNGALAVLAQHHEHADGSGFPQRLTSDRMTTAARIVAIVNRYDNLCNPPPRVHPLTPHEAVSMLFSQGRTRFDQAVLGSFIRMMGVYPAGSLVQLTDDRYAMVVGVNASRPLKPRVLVADVKVPRPDALVLNLETAPDVGIRRSLVASKLPPPVLEYLDPRPRVAYYFEALTVHTVHEEATA